MRINTSIIRLSIRHPTFLPFALKWMKLLGCMATWGVFALTAPLVMPHSQHAANWCCAIGSISWWPAWRIWTQKATYMIKWLRPWIMHFSSVAREPANRRETVSGGKKSHFLTRLFSVLKAEILLLCLKISTVDPVHCKCVYLGNNRLLIFANRNLLRSLSFEQK